MNSSTKSLTAIILCWFVVVILSIAFGYIEAAVVVYLREIFHPEGFTFPLASAVLTSESRNLLSVEVGREAATLVLILAGCMLAGRNRRQRLAYFMTIFAVWDIFYYVWLKVIIGWPASLLDFDVLFLIPMPWAGPVLAPVLVSLAMLILAAVILYRDYFGRPIMVFFSDWLGFWLSGLIIIASFCIAGKHMGQADYAEHFWWSLFSVGLVAGIIIFTRCVYRRKSPALRLRREWRG